MAEIVANTNVMC